MRRTTAEKDCSFMTPTIVPADAMVRYLCAEIVLWIGHVPDQAAGTSRSNVILGGCYPASLSYTLAAADFPR